MTETIQTTGPTGAPRGVSHLALATRDLDATLAFYRDVLGLRVAFEAPANPHHGRHAMIATGGPGLHFFEVEDARVFGFPGGVPKGMEFLPGALQHLSFEVEEEAAALALRERLRTRGVPTTPVLEVGRYAPGARMFFFPDPGGILLEATWRQ